MQKSSKLKDHWLLSAIVLSGCAALGYELLWTRLLALVLGGEVLGILGVLAGFFGGMVLGAYFLSERASRSQTPLVDFMRLEAIAAIYGVISPFLIYGLSIFLPRYLGPVAGDNNSFSALFLTVLIAGLVLLPATFCIGANFAYLVEARRRLFSKQKKGANMGRVYAANTLGATLGVLGSVYWVMPQLGLAWSGLFFAGIGGWSILLVGYWRKKHQATWALRNQVVDSPPISTKEVAPTASTNHLLLLLLVTGLAAIGLEIVVVHLFKQILQNTIYTFANILAVYLLGTALGAWWYQGWEQKKSSKRKKKKSKAKGVSAAAKKKTTVWSPLLFLLMLLSILWLLLILGYADTLLLQWSPTNAYYLPHLFVEFALVLLTFFFPCAVMGALFSHLMSLVDQPLVGKAYALNTFGATLAPFVFGLGLLPLAGAYFTLGIIWTMYFALLLLGIWIWQWPKIHLGGAIAIGGIMVFVAPQHLDLIRLKAGWTEIDRKEGLMGTVVISEIAEREEPFNLPMRTLQVNNRFRMGGGASFVERRMGNLPLLLANAPQSVLFLGVGTGTTLGVARSYPLANITAVEIVPEMRAVLPWFEEHNMGIINDPRLQLHWADARRFIVANSTQYDAIIMDLYHPARDGAGLLFTREHFTNLREHLSEEGLLAQWLPIHQFDLENLKTVIRTFLEVFPDAHAFLAGYNTNTPLLALLGTKQNLQLDLNQINRLLNRQPAIQQIVEDQNDLLACYFSDARGLKRLAGAGATNTDLFPTVMFEAPKGIYREESEKALTNMRYLLNYRQNFDVESLVKKTESLPPNFLATSLATWRAAGIFMEANLHLMETPPDEQSTWQKYEAAYRMQPQFSPARGKLLYRGIYDANYRERVFRVLQESDAKRLQELIDQH